MKTKKTKLALNKTTVSCLDGIEMSRVLGGDCIPPLPENNYTMDKGACSIDYSVECLAYVTTVSW